MTISNYAKFPQCIQCDNGPLNVLGQHLIRLCKQHVKHVKASTWRLLYHVPDLIQTLQRCVVLSACAVQVTSMIYPQTLAVMLGCVSCVLPGNCNEDYVILSQIIIQQPIFKFSFSIDQVQINVQNN